MVGARADRRTGGDPLFGREELLEEVDRLLDRVESGQGQGLVLIGPGGSGKSHVLRAARERAEGRRFRVLTSRALPEELPSPFSLVREFLRGSPESELTPAPDGGTVTLPIFLAPFAPPVREDIGPAPSRPAAPAAPDDLERILAPLGTTTIEGLGAGRDEMLGRLGEYFRTLAKEQPLLLAIDDLHFADPSSLEFLRRLAADLTEAPIALIATLGTGTEVPDRNRTTVEGFLRLPTVGTALVRPLTIPEVTAFVRWILGGREPDPQDVLRWHAQTEGNPLFVEQLVRTATGFGPRAGAVSPFTGRDVTEILLERVRELPEAEHRLLTYASVLGKEFDFSSLAAVAGMGEERVTENLDRLVQDGLLREKGDEVYEFVTEGVRASVYASLIETRRRILHRKAGRALAIQGRASDSDLARQFYLGRDDARAVEYSRRAAQSATRAFAFETAVAHLARALEAERRQPRRDPRVEIRLLTEEGRLLDEMGSLPRSEEALTEAVELARATPEAQLELGRALVGLAQTLNDRSEYARAEALANEATRLLDRVGSSRDLMAAHRVLGVVFWRRGDLASAETHQRVALEIAEHEGTPLELGHAMVDVANTMVPFGRSRYGASLELYQKAADLFATVEDHSARARVLMNRAVLEYGVDRTEDALRDLAIAIESAQRSRSPIWVGYCHLNLTQWQAELGRPEKARSALARAEQVLGPIGDRLGDQQLAMSRGMIAEAEGRFDEAETDFQDALARAREMRLGPEVSEMIFRLAHLALQRGDVAEARARLAEAKEHGLLGHRPDFAPRVAQLEAALSIL